MTSLSLLKSHEDEIVISNVSKSYEVDEVSRAVIKDCSFAIARNALTVLIGPSGCGKSTFIRLLAGFEQPTSGTITMDGKRLMGASPDRLVVFQESALFDWMTTVSNIEFGPSVRGRVSSDLSERTTAFLSRFGLSNFRFKYPTQLSGGMQRRAELARAMINDPKIMLLDEPFRGLDIMTKQLMLEYFSGIFEESRRTTIFITTDVDEAIFLADRLVILTNSPTRVHSIIDVALPRPRRLKDIHENDMANSIKMRALSILHEEAIKSFSSGSKAAADFVSAYVRRKDG